MAKMRKTVSLLMSVSVFIGCSNSVNTDDGSEINDSTSPLHLLKPDYRINYGELSKDSVKEDINRVFSYIDKVTPAKIVNSKGEEITDYTSLPPDAMLNQGTFRLTSYEWGVVYIALLQASETFDDNKRLA